MAIGCEIISQPQGLAAKAPLSCEMISQPHAPPLRKFSQLQNTPLAHECHFAALSIISQLRSALWNLQCLKNHIFATTPPFRRWFLNYETTPWHTSSISQPPNPISQLRNGLQKCFFLPFGCENVSFFPLVAKWAAKMFLSSLWLRKGLWNHLLATKWFVKTPCKAKGSYENANGASRPCIWRGEPRAPWDHTHEVSHSIFDLLKPSQPIAPDESSNWGDYAI